MRRLALVLLLALTSVAAPVAAQTGYRPPSPTHGTVNDFADVLDARAEADVATAFADLQATDDVQAVLVVINRVADYAPAGTSIEQYATYLFNTWALDDASSNDGVLFLVAIADRDVRIEVGERYGAEVNDNMQVVLSEYVLPAFRTDDYERGIVRGAQNIVLAVRDELPLLPNPQRAADTSRSAPRSSPFPWLAVLGLGVLLVMGGWNAVYGMQLQQRCDDGDMDACNELEYRREQRASNSSSSYRSGGGGSSSSGGGSNRSSGGGSSSGGGASGSW